VQNSKCNNYGTEVDINIVPIVFSCNKNPPLRGAASGSNRQSDHAR